MKTYDEYLSVQKQCIGQWEDKVNAAGLRTTDDMRHVFFAEFVIWDAGTERKGKKKLNIDSIKISP